MASTNKDRTTRTEGPSFITSTLDNVKRFIDRTADEVAKADVIGAGRRLADQAIDGAKDTIENISAGVSKGDVVATAHSLSTGILGNARDLVRVASEETQRINLIDAGAKVVQESLELVQRELDIAFDAGRELGDTVTDTVTKASETVTNRVEDLNENLNDRVRDVKNMMPFSIGAEPIKRPGTITRVEIEADKGVVHPEMAGGGGGSTEKAEKADKPSKK